MTALKIDRAQGRVWVMLAHGAGAGMDSAFLETMSRLLVDSGLNVARFEFAYMAARRTESVRRPPPRMPALITEYAEAIATLKTQEPNAAILIGGKSMGGRVASMIAEQAFNANDAVGCVCLGYPLHPSGKPEQLRASHLMDLECPLLMVQGERDALGSRTELQALQLSKAIEFAWITDGDHDFKPRKASGASHAGNLASAANAVAAFASVHTVR